MKILQLFNSFEIGGAEVLTYDILKNYNSDKKNYQLLVSKGGRLEEILLKDGFENITKIERDKLKVGYIKKLNRLLNRDHFQIIHVHNPLDVILAKMASIKVHCYVVYTVHNFHDNKSFFATVLKWIALNLADYRLFVSKELMNDYKTKFSLKKPHTVLYNGIDKNKFEHVKDSLRYELNLMNGETLAGMVGNFNDVRDQITVCKALDLIIHKHPNFHFVFVGAAQGYTYMDECISYCKSRELLTNVHFLGKRTDVPSILSSLDLFIYSSNKDTFGIAVVEAMMSGTPVIVNDLPVFNEITDSGEYAQLYETKNPDNLAEKVDYYLKNEKLKFILADKGKNWAVSKFSIENHLEQLESIYMNAINK